VKSSGSWRRRIWASDSAAFGDEGLVVHVGDGGFGDAWRVFWLWLEYSETH
jgi:hypothetical protein